MNIKLTIRYIDTSVPSIHIWKVYKPLNKGYSRIKIIIIVSTLKKFKEYYKIIVHTKFVS